MRSTLIFGGLLAGLLACCAGAGRSADAPAKETALFNGKNLDGWKLRNPNAKNSRWAVVGGVKLAEEMPNRLLPAKGEGVLLNGGDGRGVDLLTEYQHGDCEMSIEFVVPKGSNSGVYFQGQYEVQILDSFGKKDAELKYGDCGGIYNTSPPKTNACKAPGQWQKFEVTFRAPRFDKDGKKTANATFVKVLLNGTLIQENVEVKGPTTASLGGPEKPTGPLLLQGDHGPVAFRNIKLRLIAAK